MVASKRSTGFKGLSLAYYTNIHIKDQNCKLGALGLENTVKRNYQAASLDIKPLKRTKVA